MANKVTYTNIHMSININGILKNFKRRKMTGLFDDKNSLPVSDKLAREYLDYCLKKGWKLIPMCHENECPEFDHFGGGCPGHNTIK